MEIVLIGLLVVLWLGLCWIVGDVAEKKGGDAWTAVGVSFLFSPLVGFLYVIALPDRSKEKAAETPSARLRAVGPDIEAWTQARAEGKLCHACNAILKVALQPGEKCPECYARRK